MRGNSAPDCDPLNECGYLFHNHYTTHQSRAPSPTPPLRRIQGAAAAAAAVTAVGYPGVGGGGSRSRGDGVGSRGGGSGSRVGGTARQHEARGASDLVVIPSLSSVLNPWLFGCASWVLFGCAHLVFRARRGGTRTNIKTDAPWSDNDSVPVGVRTLHPSWTLCLRDNASCCAETPRI